MVQWSSTVIDIGTCGGYNSVQCILCDLISTSPLNKHYQSVITILTLEGALSSSSRSPATQLSDCSPLVVKTLLYNFILQHVPHVFCAYVDIQWRSRHFYVFFSFVLWYFSLSLFFRQCFELHRNAAKTHFTSDRWNQHDSYVINCDTSPLYYLNCFC